MKYRKNYLSPLGEIKMVSDGEYLIGLDFENDKDIQEEVIYQEKELKIFDETIKWLNLYFSGKEPTFTPKYKIEELTSFRKQVMTILGKIPYGTTITYQEIAEEIAKKKNIKKMSAQAVGGAVGWNPICLIIPCHRVVGANGSLTGYRGGLEKKKKLLELEKKSSLSKKERCSWCHFDNPLYVEYHDKEWGIPNFDDFYLFKMLILESFQAGLSWECVLNKRKDFEECYDSFDLEKVCSYGEEKVKELLSNEKIIRNRLKINASIHNANIFRKIKEEYGTFYEYLKVFTKGNIIYEVGVTSSALSDVISNDLKKRGMKFVGTTIIYSYLQAIGVIYSHEKNCFMYKNK